MLDLIIAKAAHKWASAFLFAYALSSVFAATAHAASSGVPKTFSLANGLQIIVIEDKRAPVVTNMVWYRVGAADEKAGKSGIAHFLEHLMFKGTKTFPAGAFDRLISQKGGSNNAFTSHDVTAYHENIGRDQLSLMMQLEADRMSNLVLSDDSVAKERQVVLEERNQRIDSQPSSILAEQMSAALFTNHRYGVEVLGWRHEIEGLTSADAIAHYKTYYTPSNAILVVAGDVTVDEVKSLAEKHFGPIPKRALPPRIRASEPPPTAPRRVELSDARVTQAELSRYYLVPSYRTGTKGEGYALDLLADVLGGGSTSALYRSLVHDQKLAVSASASYSGTSLNDSTFSISVSPAPGVSLAKVEAALDAVLAKALSGPIDPKLLARSKTRLNAAAIFARDDRETQAQLFGWGVAIGDTVEEVFAWPERIKAVPKEAVESVGRKYLKSERSVTGLLTPATKGASQ